MTAYLMLDGWAGRTKQQVEIIKETPKRYKVRLLESFPLPGGRWGNKGDEVYVPKYAIKREQ